MAADIRKIYVYDDFSSSEPLLAGCLYITPIRGGESCAFEYDEEWLKDVTGGFADPDDAFPGRRIRRKTFVWSICGCIPDLACPHE